MSCWHVNISNCLFAFSINGPFISVNTLATTSFEIIFTIDLSAGKSLELIARRELDQIVLF